MIGIADDTNDDEDHPDGGATTDGTLTVKVILKGVKSIFPAVSIERTRMVCNPFARFVYDRTELQSV